MTTIGRKPRIRSKHAGASVSVKKHIRSPRGPNGRKPKVHVNGYKRGKPAKH